MKLAHERKVRALGDPMAAANELTTTADAVPALDMERAKLLDRFQSSAATLAAIVGGPTAIELHDHAAPRSP